MLVDERGKRFDGLDAIESKVSSLLMQSLLKAATKRLPFMNSPEAQVRQVAKECAGWDWPEEKQDTIKFQRISYG